MTRAKDSLPYYQCGPPPVQPAHFWDFSDDPECIILTRKPAITATGSKTSQTLDPAAERDVPGRKIWNCPSFQPVGMAPCPKELAGSPFTMVARTVSPRAGLFLIVGVVCWRSSALARIISWAAKPVTTLPAASQLTSLPPRAQSNPQMEPTFAVILPLRPASLPTQTSLPAYPNALPASYPPWRFHPRPRCKRRPFGSAGAPVHVVQPGCKLLETIAARYHNLAWLSCWLSTAQTTGLVWGGWRPVIV